MSVTRTKDKLEVHYQQLGTCSVDTAFDGSWNKKVCEFSNLPANCVANALDREINSEEIALCCVLGSSILVVVTGLWGSLY